MEKFMKYYAKHAFYLLLLITISIGCTSNQEEYLWPKDGSKLSAVKYKLSIEDSSKILIENKDYYSLFSPEDSLIASQYEIYYNSLNKDNAPDYFKTRANHTVRNTANPQMTEYYKFEKGNVLLAGYTTGDTLKPFTVFEPALNISPSSGKMKSGEVISEGMMKKFLADSATFDKGFKTKLKVRDIDTLKIKDGNGTIKGCYLREITLSRDATIGFGGTDLIVPEAILLKSKVLIDEKGIPLAEWSIKSEAVENDTAEPEKMQDRKLYIELTKYYKQ